MKSLMTFKWFVISKYIQLALFIFRSTLTMKNIKREPNTNNLFEPQKPRFVCFAPVNTRIQFYSSLAQLKGQRPS